MPETSFLGTAVMTAGGIHQGGRLIAEGDTPTRKGATRFCSSKHMGTGSDDVISKETSLRTLSAPSHSGVSCVCLTNHTCRQQALEIDSALTSGARQTVFPYLPKIFATIPLIQEARESRLFALVSELPALAALQLLLSVEQQDHELSPRIIRVAFARLFEIAFKAQTSYDFAQLVVVVRAMIPWVRTRVLFGLLFISDPELRSRFQNTLERCAEGFAAANKAIKSHLGFDLDDEQWASKKSHLTSSWPTDYPISPSVGVAVHALIESSLTARSQFNENEKSVCGATDSDVQFLKNASTVLFQSQHGTLPKDRGVFGFRLIRDAQRLEDSNILVSSEPEIVVAVNKVASALESTNPASSMPRSKVRKNDGFQVVSPGAGGQATDKTVPSESPRDSCGDIPEDENQLPAKHVNLRALQTMRLVQPPGTWSAMALLVCVGKLIMGANVDIATAISLKQGCARAVASVAIEAMAFHASVYFALKPIKRVLAVLKRIVLEQSEDQKYNYFQNRRQRIPQAEEIKFKCDPCKRGSYTNGLVSEVESNTSRQGDVAILQQDGGGTPDPNPNPESAKGLSAATVSEKNFASPRAVAQDDSDSFTARLTLPRTKTRNKEVMRHALNESAANCEPTFFTPLDLDWQRTPADEAASIQPFTVVVRPSVMDNREVNENAVTELGKNFTGANPLNSANMVHSSKVAPFGGQYLAGAAGGSVSCGGDNYNKMHSMTAITAMETTRGVCGTARPLDALNVPSQTHNFARGSSNSPVATLANSRATPVTSIDAPMSHPMDDGVFGGDHTSSIYDSASAEISSTPRRQVMNTRGITYDTADSAFTRHEVMDLMCRALSWFSFGRIYNESGGIHNIVAKLSLILTYLAKSDDEKYSLTAPQLIPPDKKFSNRHVRPASSTGEAFFAGAAAAEKMSSDVLDLADNVILRSFESRPIHSRVQKMACFLHAFYAYETLLTRLVSRDIFAARATLAVMSGIVRLIENGRHAEYRSLRSDGSSSGENNLKCSSGFSGDRDVQEATPMDLHYWSLETGASLLHNFDDTRSRGILVNSASRVCDSFRPRGPSQDDHSTSCFGRENQSHGPEFPQIRGWSRNTSVSAMDIPLQPTTYSSAGPRHTTSACQARDSLSLGRCSKCNGLVTIPLDHQVVVDCDYSVTNSPENKLSGSSERDDGGTALFELTPSKVVTLQCSARAYVRMPTTANVPGSPCSILVWYLLSGDEIFEPLITTDAGTKKSWWKHIFSVPKLFRQRRAKDDRKLGASKTRNSSYTSRPVLKSSTGISGPLDPLRPGSLKPSLRCSFSRCGRFPQCGSSPRGKARFGGSLFRLSNNPSLPTLLASDMLSLWDRREKTAAAAAAWLHHFPSVASLRTSLFTRYDVEYMLPHLFLRLCVGTPCNHHEHHTPQDFLLCDSTPAITCRFSTRDIQEILSYLVLQQGWRLSATSSGSKQGGGEATAIDRDRRADPYEDRRLRQALSLMQKSMDSSLISLDSNEANANNEVQTAVFEILSALSDDPHRLLPPSAVSAYENLILGASDGPQCRKSPFLTRLYMASALCGHCGRNWFLQQELFMDSLASRRKHFGASIRLNNRSGTSCAGTPTSLDSNVAATPTTPGSTTVEGPAPSFLVYEFSLGAVCSGCQLVRYCSFACSRANAELHRTFCCRCGIGGGGVEVTVLANPIAV